MSWIKTSVFMVVLITALSLIMGANLAGISTFQVTQAQAADEYEHLRIGLPKQIVSLDPLGYRRTARPELNVQMSVFDHLLRRDEEGKIVGHLATDYKWLNDTTLRIKLRQGVTFQNGDKFTAADVKWSIEDMLDPDRGPGLAEFVKGIAKVEVIDDYTVDIHTAQPFPTLPARLTCYTPMVSAKQRSTMTPEEYEKNPLGTGPFKFVEWKKGDRIVFERNENYWKGIPKIKKLTFFPLPDHTTRVSALKAGSIDIAMDIPPSLAKQLQGVAGIEVTSVPSVRVQFIYMRTDQPPFDNKKVRQALNYAINLDEYINTIVEGYGVPYGQVVPRGFFGYNPKVKPYPYDPGKAKQLLAEAGYPKGFTVKILAMAPLEETTRPVLGYLKEVGIDAKLEVKEFSAAYADLLERKIPPMFAMHWGNWNLLDTAGTLPFVFGCEGKWSYFCHPRIEEISKELETSDEQKRLKLAYEAAEIIHEEAPHIFLYVHNDIHAKREGIPEFKARMDNTINLKWVKGEK